MSLLWQQTTNCIVDTPPWTKFEVEFESLRDVVDAHSWELAGNHSDCGTYEINENVKLA